MKYVETVAPTAEPVTYAEAKAQIRLDDDTDQLYINNLIVAARFYAESVINRSLVTRTIAATHYGTTNAVTSIGSNMLALPRGPVQSITTITDGQGNTVSNTTYELRRIGNVDYAYFKQVPNFPATVTYQAGFGTPAQIPAHIKAGILMHVAHLWYSREAVTDGQSVSVAHGLDAIYGVAGTGEVAI